ncbi:MAG: hypothetical protein EXQ85_03625 [Alphaproteobacteria bacterium]|nr:hypothetical protein [Alphaproteobacteria bacterium]
MFYDGTQFPAEYRGDAFVVLHGSWNASKPVSYSVVRVPFRDGRPQGHYEIFMGVFRVGSTSAATEWGRPVGLVLAKDGSLLVADDESQMVWRVSYGP